MSNTGKTREPQNFELHFTHRNDGKLISYDKIVATDLVSLCAQFQLVLANTSRRLVEAVGGFNDDDIPF